MTMGSRVLGLVRDHFQATFFGTGVVATAWEIAYTLPNMLRNLLAEGALAQAFIPVYSEALRESPEEARRVSGVIISFLFFFLICIVGLGIASFPFLLPAYTGQTSAEAALLIQLSQVMFVYILTVSLTSLFAGISNTHLFFTVPALSPILLNIVFISAFVVLIPRGNDAALNAQFLAMAVVAGGVLQLLVQVIFVRVKGWWPALTLRFRDPALRKIFVLMAPAVLGASLFQLNQLLDIFIASYFIPIEEGAVPALRFAHRLMQLPTGIVGTALSTAILPALTAGIREGRKGENAGELASALSFALFLTVPAGIGLLVLGPSIIDLLFYGGQWTEKSTEATWIALRFYCLGVPAYSINKILTSAFYAHQDTRTPVRVMLVVIVVNLALNLVLVHYLKQGGLALSTALGAMLTAVLLTRALRRKMEAIRWRDLARSLIKPVLLWAVILVFLLVLRHALAEQGIALAWGRVIAGWFDSPHIPRYTGLVHVAVSIPSVMVLYLGLAYVMGVEQLNVLRQLRRR